MNLYKLHTNPAKLDGWNERLYIPAVAYSLLTYPQGEWLDNDEVDIAMETIKTEPMLAAEYAVEHLEERWPEAEPYIMKNANAAFMYAGHVIGGRWKDAEPYIMKDPKYAYHYATSILQRPWPEAEKYIKQNELWWNQYYDKYLFEPM